MVQPLGVLLDRINGGQEAIVVGFGQTDATDVKQYLSMTSMTNADCRRAYQFNPYNAVRIFESNLCFSSSEGSSTCGGGNNVIAILFKNISGKRREIK